METYFCSSPGTNGPDRSFCVAAGPLIVWSDKAVHPSGEPDTVFRSARPDWNHRDQVAVSGFERRQRMVCVYYHIVNIDNRLGVYGNNVYQETPMGDGSFCGARTVQPVVGLSSDL